MKHTGIFLYLLLVAASLSASAADDKPILPSETLLYAVKDSTGLYLDVYQPATETGKPTILFAFGGGFKGGHRDAGRYLNWFKSLSDNGYRVVSMDYRLALKGRKVGPMAVNTMYEAISVAVEDMFSATAYLIANAQRLGVDPSGIVISGSSAGAITALQAEWELCNGSPASRVLPEGFRYAGVISFAGAILSKKGQPRFKVEPCPILMFHGTEDRIVNYDKIEFANIVFAGSSHLAKRFSKAGYNYNIYRVAGRRHEICECMDYTLDYQYEFLEDNVMRGIRKIMDCTVDDPRIVTPPGWPVNRKGLY